MRLKRRIYREAHILVNRLAWKFARPSGPRFGIALRIDKTRWLWRLNYWLAGKWLADLGRRRAGP